MNNIFKFKLVNPLGPIFLIGNLALSVSALAADSVTPAIRGVVDGGTKIEFIKDGFKGTEGPIALPDGSVIFTETQASRISRIAADGTVSTFLENSNGSNGLAFNTSGELITVQNLSPRVGVVYPPGHEKVFTSEFDGKPFQRPNDLVIDKRGGVYFTDIGIAPKPEKPEPARPAVYYVTPEGKLQRLVNDVERPNGVQLSPEEKVLYLANTAGEYILAYDIAEDGSLGQKRNFAKLLGYRKTETGFSSGADGLAVDEIGRLYVASNEGIEIFSSTGEAVGIIPLPQKPQNLAFAGKDKKTLYV
jgi:gluconolactonase